MGVFSYFRELGETQTAIYQAQLENDLELRAVKAQNEHIAETQQAILKKLDELLEKVDELKDLPTSDTAFQEGVNAILGYTGPKGVERQ